jgi:hypothetical protein
VNLVVKALVVLVVSLLQSPLLLARWQSRGTPPA